MRCKGAVGQDRGRSNRTMEQESEGMKTVTLELTFKDDEDYYRFLDNFGCADEDEDIRIPYRCKIKWVSG